MSKHGLLTFQHKITNAQSLCKIIANAEITGYHERKEDVILVALFFFFAICEIQ